jgi:hypothetical protein
LAAPAREERFDRYIEHRRGTGHGLQQFAEIAQGVRADHVAVVGWQGQRDLVGTEGVDVEMVVPELRQNLAQWVAAVSGADEGCRDDFAARTRLFGAVALGIEQGPQRLDGLVQGR